MDIDRDHVVHLVNGRLTEGSPDSTTSRADLARMINAALALPNPELVIHFHGGLVGETSGREIAARLAPRYTGASRYPLFFVWEAGFIEAIANNLDDIRNDPLFRELVKKATRWVLRQLPGVAGLKGAGGQVDPKTLDDEYDAWFNGTRTELPTALHAASAAAPVSLKSANAPASENELAIKIRLDLQNEAAFNATMATLHASITPAKVDAPEPKSNGIGATVSPLTEVAPEQVGAVFDVTPQTKGVFSIAKAALFIARVVIAVVRRFRHGRAHGVYTTIVEEVLAAAYLDKVGGIIWGQMKKDTSDAFGSNVSCGGSALLNEIAAQQKAAGKQFKRIVLIGHSTGAIYICNLIDRASTLLPDAKFDVVFLAPAVTHARFAQTLDSNADRIARFRQFGMQDAVESDDVLVPIVYPRSLLYFVSGVVEFTEHGEKKEREADTPLVGMERYRLDDQTFGPATFPHIAKVAAFYQGHPNSVIWSLTADGSAPGFGCASKRHGDFDNDPLTLDSVGHGLDHGF